MENFFKVDRPLIEFGYYTYFLILISELFNSNIIFLELLKMLIKNSNPLYKLINKICIFYISIIIFFYGNNYYLKCLNKVNKISKKY
jgi:hypothetical protein